MREQTKQKKNGNDDTKLKEKKKWVNFGIRNWGWGGGTAGKEIVNHAHVEQSVNTSSVQIIKGQFKIGGRGFRLWKNIWAHLLFYQTGIVLLPSLMLHDNYKWLQLKPKEKNGLLGNNWPPSEKIKNKEGQRQNLMRKKKKCLKNPTKRWTCLLPIGSI